MSILDELLAKSDPPMPLKHHLSDVRNDAHTLLTPARLRAFARVGVGTMRAEELLLSAAWLHDWGKAPLEWQNDLKAGKQILPQHSLTGFLAALWAMGLNNTQTLPDDRLDLLAVALAVLGHHGQLSHGSFVDTNFANQRLTIPWDAWAELLTDVPLRDQPKAGPPCLHTKKVCDIAAHAKARLNKLDSRSRFRGLYCLLLTLLVQADHAASGGHAPDTRIITPPRCPGSLTTFQEDVKASALDILCAIAGCGSGKTLAALLQAAEYAQNSHVDRIILCLPTRFTGNSLLRDMTDKKKYAYLGNQVGLVHSEALQVLQGREQGAGDEIDFADAQDIASRSVRYEMPVTVSTVDHLLMSLYHGYKFADRAFGNLLSSLVVFDEVHAYDAVTLNAIREGLHVLEHYGVPTLFMSATLPSSRRHFFNLSSTQTVIETDNPYYPFRMKQLKEPLTVGKGVSVEASPETRRCLRNAKNIKLAVYVNQVERAKALARAARKELPSTTVFCYHSELAPKDRQALEKDVINAFKEDAPVVLIATQAAELSLDISAERMITEIATADTLVQRAGRLHRSGKTPYNSPTCDECSLCNATRLGANFKYHLLVAPLDLTPNDKGECPAALPYKEFSLLKQTWDTAPWGKVFTFECGLKWCETVLTEPPPIQHPGLWNASVHDSVFGRKPQENFAGEGNPDGISIRDIDDDVVLALPEKYAYKMFATLTELAQYQVPVRNKKYRQIDPGLVDESQTRSFTIGRGRQQKTIEYPIKIIKSNLTYDPQHGGFDFRVDDVPLPPDDTGDCVL